MKALNLVVRTLATSAAVAGCLVAPAGAQEQNLVGTWACSMAADDPESGMRMSFDFEMTYDGDGSYHREGQMNFSMAAVGLDSTIEMTEAGTWSLSGLTLTETRTDLSFDSLSEEPSPIESMLLSQMQAAAESTNEETVQLSSLTATTLEFAQDGESAACNKT